MKLLLYTDLHIREEYLDECRVILKQIGREALRHEVDYVWNLGDTFHVRGQCPTVCLNVLTSEWEVWHENGIKQGILIGNHDQQDKAGEIHPLKAFKKWGWLVVDKPKLWNGIALFPYMPKPAISVALEKLKNKTVNTAFVHWGIQGAMRNDWNKDMDGVPIQWLRKFKLVFCGHYHYRNQFENVQYVGSPLQQNFAEMGQDKGYMIFNTKTKKYKFYKLAGPKYHEIEFKMRGKGKYGDLKVEEEIRDCDFVRCRVTGDAESVSRLKIEDLRTLVPCRSLKIIKEIKEKAVSRLNIEPKEIHNHKSLMKKYLEFVETDLSKKDLWKIGREIASDVQG